ncbi:MAG: hypothetical protein PHC40_06860, partial [Eubacteriales bacterium]|nr:hypothetical protein [Eubacteriales bacterium]
MQEQLFKEFFLKSSMAISYYKAILDAEGHFKEAELIDANKAFEKIVGQKSGSLQGKYFADLFPGVDTELHKWEKAVSDALKKGTLIKHDIAYHLEKKSLLITIIPLS